MPRPLLILAALALGSPAFAGEPPRFRVERLDTPEFNVINGWSMKLNDNGVVAAYSLHPTTLNPTARYRNPDGSFSQSEELIDSRLDWPFLYAFNSRNQTIGAALGFGFDEYLLTHTPGIGHTVYPTTAYAPDLNDSGIAVLQSGRSIYRWNIETGESSLVTNNFQNSPLVFAINESGAIVGYSSDGGNRPFVANGDVISYLEVGSYANGGLAVGINDHGIMVGGISSSASTQQPAIWSSNGTLQSVLTLPGVAAFSKVNNHGWMTVGQTLGGPGGEIYYGGLYHESFGYRELNTLLDSPLPYRIEGAIALNNRNQMIVQTISYNSGISRQYYLLTPVPEPATLTAVGLGALALLRRRKTKPGPKN